MGKAKRKQNVWTRIFIREAREYLRNFVYLTCFFGVFTWYRRLILYSHQITYLDYGISLIEAAVLAKFIMVGQAFGLGRRLEHKPLIVTILYKTILFSLLVGLFSAMGRLARGVLRGEGLAGAFHAAAAGNGYELLAKSLVIFFAFIPFFAVKELGRVLGDNELRKLFFGKRAGAEYP